MRRYSGVNLLLLWLILACSVIDSRAQHDIAQRIITLGNTADLPLKDTFYQDLRSMIGDRESSTSIIVNGDFSDGQLNIHYDSLRISKLIGSVKDLKNARIIFIPGDRDWANSGSKGLNYVSRLEKLVDQYDLPNVHWPVKDGCPGPKKISLGERVMLIAIQTQWWNHPFDKPTPGDAVCKITAQEDFNEELQDLIDENGDRNILIAGHFPIISYGPYGGKWPLHKYLFPVPILSGLWPSFHSNVGTVKDISNANFTPLREQLEQVMAEQQQLIYLSAHEHNLQILKHNDHFLINSGSLSGASHSGKGPQAIYTKSIKGFIELIYFNDGQVQAIVHESLEGNLKESQRIPLIGSACREASTTLSANIRVRPCIEKAAEVSSPVALPATTTLAAGKEYKASNFKAGWLGKHYRDSWTTPVAVPYLNIDTTCQGLTPYQRGGGRQTTSLKFKAGDGGEYVFRSVNKDPTKALDHEYRQTIVGKVVRDQTSAQHPYGALVADKLLDRLDILHASPRLFVLPPDDRLKLFGPEFPKLFGMLEERPANPQKIKKPFAEADAILKSYEMFDELYEDHDNRVDAQEFARARVFDLLVGDWGKHEDNWKWAGYRQTNGMMFRPIPRDRDHVFSLWDGILPWIADREWAKPSAANFGYEFRGIKSLMWQARHLDRFLASELSRSDWINAATYIQKRFSEQNIGEAVKSMPEEIYRIDGEILTEKLKRRLQNLDQAASNYYDLLSKEVDVVGSNKRETFKVQRSADGSVEVIVRDYDKANSDTSRLFYQRRFYPEETKEIRLYGLQKADNFFITGTSKKTIPIRIIGGPGADNILDESEVKGFGKKTKIYEKSTDGALELGDEAKRVEHWNHEIYNYNRTSFKYNTYMPLLFFSSSKDFGIGIKGGMQFIRQKFGKQDYASKHAMQLAFSTENINVLDYKGSFRHVLGKWDLLIEALAADHYYFTYFFGLGNNSEKNNELFEDNYYKTSYNSYQLSAGIRNEMWEGNKSHVEVKLHYENNAEQIGENTILKDPEFNQDITGIEDTNIVESVVNVDLDFRDRVSLPEKGMRIYLQHNNGIVSSNDNKGYGVLRGSLEGFVTAYIQRPLTLGLKFGGSTSYGEVPFYKLKYLGQNNDLRGFLRNRFTGESTLFFNSELRWELSEFHTSVFPIRLGLKMFYDTGRIFSSYDLTNAWHHGYGGGFYLVPLKEEFSLNISVAFSEEESGLLLLGIGKSF